VKNKKVRKRLLIAATVIALAGSVVAANDQRDGEDDERDVRFGGGRRARNVILFIGDGMGVSTVTATRVFSVGVGGQLVMDQFP
jgi:alkaline phosphatase